MKRAGNLYSSLISDDNLRQALFEVNHSHRWRPMHKPNLTVLWSEKHIDECVENLRKIIEDGFLSSPDTMIHKFDVSAGKWRDIHEPKLWPDQYIHHALIQVLQPAMMKGMDNWCCGSIQGRGIHYGMHGIKKWMKNDLRGTRYCAEADIHHFYDSLSQKCVMDRLKSIIKDRRVLDLAERVMKPGILIGCYFSQWFANTVLQPLDQAIRSPENKISHYIRYMDNFTIFASQKKILHRVIHFISKWLAAFGLKIKSNWQVYPTKSRMPTALGYRYGHGYTLIRKRNLLRLKRQMHAFSVCRWKNLPITSKFAAGLLSRIGQLKHCNNKRLYKQVVRPKTQKWLKRVVREWTRKVGTSWNTYLELCCPETIRLRT
jgi:hypothetical protein